MEKVDDLQVHSGHTLGQRRCPNPECHAHVFFVADITGVVVRTYPAQRVAFDAKRIPDSIAKSFTDALTCHSECMFIPAAIMIRRTLEELCADKGATGKDLKERIGALRAAVILPTELFCALDDLRMLGNDAAHVEANTYSEIGAAEVDVAIELTKEVLKAVYQLDELLARLRELKR